jgi:alkylhydroperoxidase family enzyme
MSQRLTGLSHEDATGVAAEVFAASDKLMGRTSNLVRILSNHSPYIARWFFGLVATVRQPGLGAASDTRLRSLVNIKTSMINACAYCTAHTSTFGQGFGIGEAEYAALDSDAYKTSDLFTDKEKAVIAWAEAMTRNAARRDKTVWDELKRHCSDTEIVEVSMACAMFNMINRLNDSFWTELESADENKKQLAATRNLSIDNLEAYAVGFAASGQAERT